MKKIVKLGKEGRDKLIKGINILANAVTSTLGPNGKNVIYTTDIGEVRSTKDGVTVAKNIFLEDPIEDVGAQLVKQASVKTANVAGDGTTTSTLLAQKIIELGEGALSQHNLSVTDLKKGIDSAVKDIIEFLKQNIKKDITSEDQLIQIASISANNDEFVGKIVCEALNKVGREGIVHVEESTSDETYLETVEGLQFERGYKSHWFVTNNNNMTCTLENPFILIIDKKFNATKDLLEILNHVATENKSLLLICDDIDGEALSVLIVNKLKGILKVCAVKAPEFGDRKKLALEDIAVLTGGAVVSEERGMKLDKFDKTWFGQARTVIVTKDETTIVDGKGNEDQIKQRIEELKQQIEKCNVSYEKQKLQERLAKFVGGVAVIHVGGYTETEIKEKKDRVEDALQATKAAISEGIVPGGGIALVQAAQAAYNANFAFKRDLSTGYKVLVNACFHPFYKILSNAGYEEQKIYMIINRLLEKNDNYWLGYNVKDPNEMVDFYKNGIIDPFKVTRIALENAASIAGTILMTDAIIVDKPEEKEGNNDNNNNNMLY